jgi:Sulfotransferase domain.
MTDPSLPRFVIIGAIKGATTWLQFQLDNHPGVFLPAAEPHFFSQEYERGLGHYRSLFGDAGADQMLGEKSADYLGDPDAPRRLAETLPDAKLIVQLRNPVDRAYSDYKMLYRRGTITEGPQEHLRPGGPLHERLLGQGLYAHHLRRWFDLFPREQIQVLLYEDVLAEPARVVDEVCRHIGVPTHFSSDFAATRRNDSGVAHLPLGLRNLLQPIKGAVKPLRGSALFESVRGLFARRIGYPALPGNVRAGLVDYYRRDVHDLEKLIGRDLSHWCTADNARTVRIPAAKPAERCLAG